MDLTVAVVEAHDPDMAMRGAALRSGTALREAGGVFRAGNLVGVIRLDMTGQEILMK